MNEAIKVNTKNNGKSNSPRKRKSPQNYNEKKLVGEDDDGDAKMGENLGIHLVEEFFKAAGEELRNAAYGGKTDY